MLERKCALIFVLAGKFFRNPFQSQFQKLGLMGAPALRIAADHLVIQLDGPVEVFFFKYVLAGMGTVGFGIEQALRQPVMIGAKQGQAPPIPWAASGTMTPWSA